MSKLRGLLMKKLRFLHKTAIIAIIGSIVLVASVIPVQADNLQEQLNQSNQDAYRLNGGLKAQQGNVANVTTQVLALKQSVLALNNSMAREQLAMAKEEHKLQKNIVALNETMNNQKGLIIQKQAEIQVSIQDKAQTKQAVQQTLDKQETVLAQLSTDERAMLNSSLSAQAKVTRIQQLMQQEAIEVAHVAKGNNSSTTVSRGTSASAGVAGTVKVSGGAQQITSFAAQFLGTPYVWGGTTPKPGFDCSGYIQYVYRNAGISLNRTSEQQFKNGVSISRSELRSGDLVFFHTYSSGASHVGIYVGNNTMINSSNGGVSYDDMTNSYWSARYLGARRVVAP